MVWRSIGTEYGTTASQAQRSPCAVGQSTKRHRLSAFRPTARRQVHIRDQMEVFSSVAQCNALVRGWQGRALQNRYRLRRRRECDGLARGAHRSQAMRPVDTLPGGLGSLKYF